MTFKKKDPSLVTLHFVIGDGDSKRNNYRVAKYQDFVSTLQVSFYFILRKEIFYLTQLLNRRIWSDLILKKMNVTI